MAYKTVAQNKNYNKLVRRRQKEIKNITATELRDYLIYDPKTGWFFKRTGRDSHGYSYICIKGASISAHRLAWFYMTGSWPKGVIDHVDGNPTNNKFSNLRDVTFTQNIWNRKKPKNNTSGFKGVHFNKKLGKFTAKISYRGDKNRIVEHLGVFEDARQAHKAYCKAAKRLFGRFARFA